MIRFSTIAPGTWALRIGFLHVNRYTERIWKLEYSEGHWRWQLGRLEIKRRLTA